MPSRILFLVHALPPQEHSGTPLIVKQYAQELGGRGFEVGVVQALTESDSERRGAYRLDGDTFWRFGVAPTPWLWAHWGTRDSSDTLVRDSGELRLFDDLLRDFRPTLVHVIDNVNLPSDLPLLARARGIPVLRSVWNSEDLCGKLVPFLASTPPRLCPAPLLPVDCAGHYSLTLPDGEVLGGDELRSLLEAKRRFARFMFERVYDRVIFPTEPFRKFFAATLPITAEKMLVIEPGIDTGAIRAAGRGAASGPTTFLCMGNLASIKGIEVLRDAFLDPSLLGREDYRLGLHGDGDQKVIADLQEGNPRVHWNGRYTPRELPELLAGGSVGLSPSWFETFHRVTREYLAAGLPVIGTTAFGVRAGVQEGVNGLLVPPGDVAAFVTAILRVLDDRTLLNALVEGAGRTHVRSVEEEVDDLTALYSELILEG